MVALQLAWNTRGAAQILGVTSKLSHVAQPPVSSSSIIISVPSISVTLFQLSFPYASTDTMFVKSSSTLLCLQVYVCDFQTFNSFKLISQSSVISSLIVKFIKSSFQIFVIVILNIASSDFFYFLAIISNNII